MLPVNYIHECGGRDIGTVYFGVFLINRTDDGLPPRPCKSTASLCHTRPVALYPLVARHRRRGPLLEEGRKLLLSSPLFPRGARSQVGVPFPRIRKLLLWGIEFWRTYYFICVMFGNRSQINVNPQLYIREFMYFIGCDKVARHDERFPPMYTIANSVVYCCQNQRSEEKRDPFRFPRRGITRLWQFPGPPAFPPFPSAKKQIRQQDWLSSPNLIILQDENKYRNAFQE